MRIGIDMDGVIVDLAKSWLPKISARTGLNIDKSMVTTWDFSNLGLDKDVLASTLSWVHFALLQPYQGSLEAIGELKKAGHEIVIVTAPPYPRAAGEKLDWCSCRLPGVPVILVQDKDMIDLDFLIDDAPHNLLKSKAMKICVDHPYNQGCGDARIGSLAEAPDLFKKIGATP